MPLKVHEIKPETNASTHEHCDSVFQIEKSDGRRGYTTLEGEIRFRTRTNLHSYYHDMLVDTAKGERRIGTLIENIDPKNGESTFLDSSVGRGRRWTKDINKAVVAAWKRHQKDMAERVEMFAKGRITLEEI